MLTLWNPFNGRTETSALAPFADFDRLFNEMTREIARDFALPSRWLTAQALAPAADIVETEDAIEVKMDLPGHDPKQIQVKLEGDTLTIQSERKYEKQDKGSSFLRSERGYGVFARSFVLPSTVDAKKCEARYEHGVLTVSLPKREEAKPRSIDIKVQS